MQHSGLPKPREPLGTTEHRTSRGYGGGSLECGHPSSTRPLKLSTLWCIYHSQVQSASDIKHLEDETGLQLAFLRTVDTSLELQEADHQTFTALKSDILCVDYLVPLEQVLETGA
jgi:hypothetical protein